MELDPIETAAATLATHGEREIDEDLLAEAQCHLGGASEADAINVALRQFVEQWRARRLQGLESLQRMADEGSFDFNAIEEVRLTAIAVGSDTEPDIDQELLDEARRHLGVKPNNTAINEALRRLVEEKRAQRRSALRELRELSAQGAFDYDSLDRHPD